MPSHSLSVTSPTRRDQGREGSCSGVRWRDGIAELCRHAAGGTRGTAEREGGRGTESKLGCVWGSNVRHSSRPESMTELAQDRVRGGTPPRKRKKNEKKEKRKKKKERGKGKEERGKRKEEKEKGKGKRQTWPAPTRHETATDTPDTTGSKTGAAVAQRHATAGAACGVAACAVRSTIQTTRIYAHFLNALALVLTRTPATERPLIPVAANAALGDMGK